MKAGYVYWNDFPNRLIEPGLEDRLLFGTSPQYTIVNMFPLEVACYLDLYNMDYDLCNSMDMIFCTLDFVHNPMWLEVLPVVTCKKVAHLEGGVDDLTKYAIPAVVDMMRVMDLCDVVISMDKRSWPILQALTETRVIVWPLPYPVKEVLDFFCSVDNVGCYDIVIPYGLAWSNAQMRNALSSVLVAKKIMDIWPDVYRKTIIYDCVNDHQAEQAQSLIREIGCDNIDVAQYTPCYEYLATLKSAKLMINMDRRHAAGRPAIESALAKVPAVLSDQPPNAYEIYHDIGLCDPFAVTDAIEIVSRIADGTWEKNGLLDRAYNRALLFAIELKAGLLEEVVML